SFLEELCEQGANRGTGIDPSFRADRVEAKANLTFVADFYDERYGPIDADAVICRHTLEHIPDVEDFMQTVRSGIGDALDTVVLADTAFWDVYYEHCSYFGSGSLAALFARTSFDVVECFTDFDDQYLVLEARPSRSPSTALPRRQWVADHQHLRELARGFA